jgi:succinyl-CoA synthetase beta subunit
MLEFIQIENINSQGDTPMDLLEYQAKDLFRTIGIPVLSSQRIDRIQDLKRLTIPYPIVLKSQVHVGGRGRLGGIRFVDNTIDAIASAQVLFNLSILGEKPRALLAEPKFQTAHEYYLAVTLNRSLRRLVLLGSVKGGNEVRSAIDSTYQVVVEGEFSPFYTRRLAIKMGLEGPLMTSVSSVVEKMYYLLVEKDLDLVEINPLGVSASGEVMALDGKVSVNDGAMARHPDLVALAPQPIVVQLDRDPKSDSQSPLLSVQSTLETQGIVGLLCQGSGLTMATMDSFYQAGGKPIAFLNMGSETSHSWDIQTFCDRLIQGLERISQTPQVEIILLNLISGIVTGEAIATALLQFLYHYHPQSAYPRSTSSTIQENSAPSTIPQIVVRWMGPDIEGAKLKLVASPIMIFDDLDSAIGQVLKLVKQNKTKA